MIRGRFKSSRFVRAALRLLPLLLATAVSPAMSCVDAPDTPSPVPISPRDREKFRALPDDFFTISSVDEAMRLLTTGERVVVVLRSPKAPEADDLWPLPMPSYFVWSAQAR